MEFVWDPPDIPEIVGRHLYDIAYAQEVHYGAVFENGIMPARPWIDVTLKETDFAAAVAEHFRVRASAMGFADALKTAFVLANEDLGLELQGNILQERWEWPRSTWRVTGEIVDSPRNIYSTGDLFDSYSLNFLARS